MSPATQNHNFSLTHIQWSPAVGQVNGRSTKVCVQHATHDGTTLAVHTQGATGVLQEAGTHTTKKGTVCLHGVRCKGRFGGFVDRVLREFCKRSRYRDAGSFVLRSDLVRAVQGPECFIKIQVGVSTCIVGGALAIFQPCIKNYENQK